MTEVDEGKGLVKVYWRDVRERVAVVEPTFARLVDEISPDKSFPLFLAYYPYGEFVGDTQTPFIPKAEGGCYRLSDPNAPKEVIKHLGYGKNDSPLAMVLEKEMEWFVDLKDEGISIPWLVYSPGRFFSFARHLSNKSNRIYAPNSVTSGVSGSRTAFMLPNIGSITHHANLQRDFNVKSRPPKFLYEHWNLFKEVINSKVFNCDWRCCVLYFAEKWVNKIHADKAWVNLKAHLHELAWHYFEYERSRIYYDIAFSVIQKKRNLKPNPYLTDTARHLFTIAIGSAPGYAPACNNNALPLDILQRVWVESYGLKKYFPTIMQPVHFNFERSEPVVYYSLKYPSTYVFSPKSRQISSTLFEMHELEHIMRIFVEEFSDDTNMCADTVINKIAKEVRFRFYHNEFDRHNVIRPSTEIPQFDKCFNFVVSPQYKISSARFAADSPFVRGCISINAKS